MPQILFGLLIIALAVLIIVYVIFPLALISAGVGAVIGFGTAIYNYINAFRNNVKPERA